MAFPAPAHAAMIRGTVVDATGAGIDAYVFVYDSSKHPAFADPLPGVTTVANRSGKFTVTVPQGLQDVCVFSAGFSATCRKVYLRRASSTVVQKFKMVVDPLVTKEFGDSFPTH